MVIMVVLVVGVVETVVVLMVCIISFPILIYSQINLYSTTIKLSLPFLPLSDTQQERDILQLDEQNLLLNFPSACLCHK